jgi:hypothetical protein
MNMHYVNDETNHAYMDAVYWNGLPPQQHIQAHASLARMTEFCWGFCGTVMEHHQ